MYYDVKEREQRKYACIALVCILLIIVVGGSLLKKYMDKVPPTEYAQRLTPTEKSNMLALQQAKPGDFAITETGEILRINRLDGGSVYYSHYSYFSSEGFPENKPLVQVARFTMDVVGPYSGSFTSIKDCFTAGMLVTKDCEDRWICKDRNPKW